MLQRIENPTKPTVSAVRPARFHLTLEYTPALNPQAVFAPPKAIRGGIPICFPQFSDFGPLSQQHGFARNQQWEAGRAFQQNAI